MSADFSGLCILPSTKAVFTRHLANFRPVKTRAFTCSVHGTTLERISLNLKNGFGKSSLFVLSVNG